MIRIFQRHCQFSSNSANKQRPEWFNREKIFDSFKDTFTDEINYTAFYDTLNGSEHFIFNKGVNIVETEGGSEAKSFNNLLKYVYKQDFKEDDIIYFVEDDYLHKNEAITEMLFTYEKISSQVGKEIFLCPVDYPYLYKDSEKTNILIGHQYHWRTIKESLLTFMTSKQMLNKHWLSLVKMGSEEHSPFETPLHKIYEDEICLSPIPSLAMHCTNVNSVFGLSPNINWEKLWDENK